MSTQSPHEVCENTFNGTDTYQREMHGTVPDATGKMAHFVAQELAEIDVLADECNTFN